MALQIAVAFAVVGVIWMVVMDILIYSLVRDAALFARIDTTMDWAFVMFACIGLYVFSHKVASRLSRTRSVLAAVVHSIGDGVLLLGPDQTIVHANPAALQILGCEEASEVLGLNANQFFRRFFVTFTNGSVVTPEAFAAQRAFDEDGVLRYKLVIHPSANREVAIDAAAAGVRTRPGTKAALVVSVLHDITDTEHLEKLRDQFFAAAAHSLKTPVAIIKTNVQFLARTTDGAQRPQFLAIERQCARIDRLVQNLQVISRARSHSLELHMHEMDLGPLIVQTCDELLAMRSVLDVRTDIAETPPIRGDRERLATVVRNLSYNALRASTPHSPLTLELRPHATHIELAVRYHALPVAERTFAAVDEYDDTALSRHATETIVKAHGGELGEFDGDDRLGVLWVRLPTMEVRG